MIGRVVLGLAGLALLAFVLAAVFARYLQPGLAPAWLNTLMGCG